MISNIEDRVRRVTKANVPNPRIAAGTSQAPGELQSCCTILISFNRLAKMTIKKIARTKLGTETPTVEMKREM